jgi:hypothetical protein
MGYVLNGQEGGEKQVVLVIEEQIRCIYTNTIREGPNGRHSKNLTLKSKPKLLGQKGAKGEIKEIKNHMGKNLKSPIVLLMTNYDTMEK